MPPGYIDFYKMASANKRVSLRTVTTVFEELNQHLTQPLRLDVKPPSPVESSAILSIISELKSIKAQPILRPIADILNKHRQHLQTAPILGLVDIVLNQIDRDVEIDSINQWNGSLTQLLERKHILYAFANNPHKKPSLDVDISVHAKWLYEHIYAIGYQIKKTTPGFQQQVFVSVPRLQHGIAHVVRVAIYTRVFANLFLKYDDSIRDELSPRDVKLLQIAALFHDSARERDGEDLWDHESAVFLYYYLTRILSVEKSKAKEIAEATANKDPKPDQFFTINEDESGKVTWEFVEKSQNLIFVDSVYRQILHDSDSLDIIRARPYFNARHLCFYHKVATKIQQAFEVMALLITEARSLIDIQGDSFSMPDKEIKAKYNQENAYQLITSDVSPTQHPIIFNLNKRLFSKEELSQKQIIPEVFYDPALGMTEANMIAAMRSGKLFARAIGSPSAISIKHPISFAKREFDKMNRELGIPTDSNSLEKFKNPLRSITMLAYGSGIYADNGLLILNPDRADISCVSETNIVTGRGKKDHLKHLQDKSQRPTPAIIQDALSELLYNLKMGGKALTSHTSHHATSHNEILYDIGSCSAFYYSLDGNAYNERTLKSPKATHPHSALLQVLFTRKTHELAYHQTKQAYIKEFGISDGTEKFIARHGSVCPLPVFEYSGIHHILRLIPESELCDDNIVIMWTEMCSAFMKKRIEDPKVGSEIYSMSITDIKTLSLYQFKENLYARYNAPADTVYSEGLQKRINEAIQLERDRLLTEYSAQYIRKIHDQNLTYLHDSVFFQLFKHPGLMTQLQTEINRQITMQLNDRHLFSLQTAGSFFDEHEWQLSVIQCDTADEFVNQNRRSEYAHIIFKTKASKAFWLCKALHLVHLQAHLQKKAEALLSEELSSVILEPGQKKSGFDQNHYEIVLKALGSFDKFVTLFELPEKYVSLIAEKLTQVFRYLTQVSRQQDFMTIVNHYIEQGWKDHVLANKEILKRTQLRLEEFSSSHNAKSAADYVELTALLGENSRDRLLVWLGNVNLMFKSEDIKIQLGRIVKIFPLNKDNIDLFTRIMDRLVFPGFGGEITDICKWVMYITLIKRYCPNRTFLPEQQSILEAKLTQVTAIFEKKSAIEEYNLLAQNELCSFGEALTMLNQNFSVTIPSTFLDFFNRAIKSNFRNLTSDGAKLVIKMQKKFETLTDPESKSQSNSIPVPTTFV